jgi:CheY-like chemotaxis protein
MNVVTAPGAAEARRLILDASEREDSFDLILTDVCMPGEDGFSLIKELRPRLGKARVVLLTSAGTVGDAVKCRSAGVDAYLAKPVRSAELHSAILAVLAEAGSPESSARPSLVTRHVLEESKRHLRILLAEDNPVNQRVAMRMLEKQGHSVHLTTNGREAVTVASERSFDLILMDLQMPEMDGLQATAQIRRRDLNIPIIAMTAHARLEDRQRCLSHGMTDYISKPLRREDLYAIIERCTATPSQRAAQAIRTEF